MSAGPSPPIPSKRRTHSSEPHSTTSCRTSPSHSTSMRRMWVTLRNSRSRVVCVYTLRPCVKPCEIPAHPAAAEHRDCGAASGGDARGVGQAGGVGISNLLSAVRTRHPTWSPVLASGTRHWDRVSHALPGLHLRRSSVAKDRLTLRTVPLPGCGRSFWHTLPGQRL